MQFLYVYTLSKQLFFNSLLISYLSFEISIIVVGIGVFQLPIIWQWASSSFIAFVHAEIKLSLSRYNNKIASRKLSGDSIDAQRNKTSESVLV